MMARTHVLLGLAASVAVSVVKPTLLPYCGVAMAFTVVGSLTPDLDHPNSWFGRRLWFLSMPLSVLFGHRGITHSLLAGVGATAGLAWYGLSVGRTTPLLFVFLVAFLVGYLSHLFGDWMSSSGIPLLWPMQRKFRAPCPVSTGGVSEWGIRWVLAAFLLFWVAIQGVPPLI